MHPTGQEFYKAIKSFKVTQESFANQKQKAKIFDQSSQPARIRILYCIGLLILRIVSLFNGIKDSQYDQIRRCLKQNLEDSNLVLYWFIDIKDSYLFNGIKDSYQEQIRRCLKCNLSRLTKCIRVNIYRYVFFYVFFI